MNTRITLDLRKEKDDDGLFNKVRKGDNANVNVCSRSSTNDESSRVTVNKTNCISSNSNKTNEVKDNDRIENEERLYVLSNGKLINKIDSLSCSLNSNASSMLTLFNYTRYNKENQPQVDYSERNLEFNELVSIPPSILSLSSYSSSSFSSVQSPSLTQSSVNNSNDNCDIGFRNYFIKRNEKIKGIQTAFDFQSKTPFVPMTIPILSKSYKEYKLIKNTNKSHTPINEYLPKKDKNNEEYKRNLFRYYRNPSISDTKSVNCKYASYYNSANESNPSLLSKRSYMKISERKIYSSEQPLYDYKLNQGYSLKTKPYYFKFYFDKDIGFERVWQKQLSKAEMDDDVDTEDDILKGSSKRVMNELVDGIELFKKNRRSCRNYDYYHS